MKRFRCAIPCVLIRTGEYAHILQLVARNEEKLTAVERDTVDTQEQALALHKKKVNHQLREDAYVAPVERCSKRIQELETFRYCMSTDATSNDGLVIKALVETIVVYDDHIAVRFKCGATVEQKYVA